MYCQMSYVRSKVTLVDVCYVLNAKGRTVILWKLHYTPLVHVMHLDQFKGQGLAQWDKRSADSLSLSDRTSSMICPTPI